MKSMKWVMVGTVLAMGLPAMANTITLGPGGVQGVIADTFLYDNEVRDGDGIQLGTADTWGLKHMLLRFDLATAGLPIGPDTVINSVTLSLQDIYGVGTPAGGQQPSLTLFLVKTTWVESQATWSNAATGTPWEVPGATGASDVDLDSAVVTGSFAGPSGAGARFDIPGLLTFVQAWANGTPNEGVLIEYTNASPAAGIFAYSSRTGTTGPILTIDYSVIPEPATMVLLAAGWIGMLIRRRRAA